MSGDLLVAHDAGVTTLTINRPPLNLMTTSLLQEIVTALEMLRTRDETRAMSMIDLIEEHPKPVISAVRGWCIGGGTAIAWPCDIRLAAASAKFRAGDIYLGLAPTWGLGNARLVHYLGRNRTLDTSLLGDDITAQEAYDWGLVTRVFPDDSFDAEVARIAHKLAGGAPLPNQAIKEAVRAQYRDSPDRAALLTERWQRVISASDDALEGVRAALEKRKPIFKGR
jgi:enoyl-CoA hydratase